MDLKNRHELYGEPITIGRNVWFESNVMILQGLTISGVDITIIAAGAVVTKNVP